MNVKLYQLRLFHDWFSHHKCTYMKDIESRVHTYNLSHNDIMMSTRYLLSSKEYIDMCNCKLVCSVGQNLAIDSL